MRSGQNQSGIVWIEPPEKMEAKLQEYGRKVLAAVVAVAQFMANKMQTEARQNAPWEDRTGNARSGLFGIVETEVAIGVVEIYLSHGHTIFYGQYLEQNYGGRYAIIMPTIQKNLPELKRLLDGIFL